MDLWNNPLTLNGYKGRFMDNKTHKIIELNNENLRKAE
jgi:hypothetical protein